jgi:hypothetical protein
MPDVTLTTMASPLARSAGSAARVSRIGARRSTVTIASISASVVFSSRPARTPPALLTRMSSPPRVSSACVSVAARPSALPTSAATQVLDRGGQAGRPPARHDHLRALGEQGLGHCLADTARSAGDENSLAV